MVDSQALWIITDRQINARFSNRSPFILNTFFLTRICKKCVVGVNPLFLSVFVYKILQPWFGCRITKIRKDYLLFQWGVLPIMSSSFGLNFLILEAIKFKIFKLMSNLQKGLWMFITFVSYTVVWGVTTYLAFIMS